MAWTYVLCETQTGTRLQTLTPISAGTWGRRLAYKGSGSHSFLLSENPGLAGDFSGPRRTLVVCWDGEPWYAGILWKRQYDHATGIVTFGHADLWSIWERRLAGPQFQSMTIEGRSIIETRVTYTTSLRTHLKRAVQLGMIGPRLDLPEYQLPVVLPPDEAGGFVTKYWTYDFLTVAEALSSVMDRTLHTAVDFHPRWSSGGGLEWEMLYVRRGVGDVTNELFLSVDSDKTEVSNLTVSDDFEHHATEVHVTGEGSETGTLHQRRWNQWPVGDRVALHHHEAMSEVKDIYELIDRVEGEFQARQTVPQQVECSARIGGELSPTSFWLGRTVTLRVHKEGCVLEPGYHRRQVIGVTSSGVDAVKLELIPV